MRILSHLLVKIQRWRQSPAALCSAGSRIVVGAPSFSGACPAKATRSSNGAPGFSLTEATSANHGRIETTIANPFICLLLVPPIGALRSGEPAPTVLPLLTRVATLMLCGIQCRRDQRVRSG